ncbi:uncharacterized protein LOC112056717 [Bicyclus anynana]|uniref:Uncharacterized protein LOC112056717 n=1 Tax=Bicyclus anynana TaxID=110368 RepID=A0A6J1P594_BICAN|nr:uncharacterized protein LOC112056717 [Bicyclus anynana]
MLGMSLTVGIVLLFRFINKKYEHPIFGIYQQRNKTYWFKFLFMYIFLRLRQFITYVKRLLAIELGRSPDGTTHVQEHDIQLEKLYDLGTHSKVVDGVYFNGMSKSGDALICGLARRPNRGCDAFIYLKIKDQDLFLSPSLPDTHLKKSDEDGEGHCVNGITITNFIPMRAWKLCFNGELKPKSDSAKTVKVEAELTWSAQWAPFEYDTQMSPRSVADDMAREPWSRDYFKLVKKLHQTHYEQMGSIAGTVAIDGKSYELNMPCVRDRSFGPLREWRNFHRYVYHFIFLDNGDCMAVGSVSQPSILSHLTIGYLCRKSDQTVVPVDHSDFHLYQHAEHQILPKHYGFIFEAGGQSYAVQVSANEEETFYIGKEREAKFYERWCTVDINGVKGRACVEWHYNNTLNTLFNK